MKKISCPGTGVLRKLTSLFVISLTMVVVDGLYAAAQTPPAQTPAVPPVAAPTPEGKGAVPDCLVKAHEKFIKEGPYKSLDLFRACCKELPDNPLVHFWTGMVYFAARQPKDAADSFKTVLKLDPQNIQAKAMLGKVYSFEDDKLDLAEELLSGVLASHPELDDARIDLGRVYGRKKQLDKALKEFGRVLVHEKRFAVYHLELGRIFMSLGAKDEAKKQFERALVLEPGFAAAEEGLKQLDQQAKGAAPSGTPPAQPKAK